MANTVHFNRFGALSAVTLAQAAAPAADKESMTVRFSGTAH